MKKARRKGRKKQPRRTRTEKKIGKKGKGIKKENESKDERMGDEEKGMGRREKGTEVCIKENPHRFVLMFQQMGMLSTITEPLSFITIGEVFKHHFQIKQTVKGG